MSAVNSMVWYCTGFSLVQGSHCSAEPWQVNAVCFYLDLDGPFPTAIKHSCYNFLHSKLGTTRQNRTCSSKQHYFLLVESKLDR